MLGAIVCFFVIALCLISRDPAVAGFLRGIYGQSSGHILQCGFSPLISLGSINSRLLPFACMVIFSVLPFVFALPIGHLLPAATAPGEYADQDAYNGRGFSGA